VSDWNCLRSEAGQFREAAAKRKLAVLTIPAGRASGVSKTIREAANF